MASFMTKGTQILVTAEAIMKTIMEPIEMWGICIELKMCKVKCLLFI